MPEKNVAIIHQHHITVVLAILGVLVILLFLMIWPAMSGHSIKKQFSAIGKDVNEVLAEIETLKGKVQQTELQVQLCEQAKTEFARERDAERNVTLACNEQRRNLESDMQQQQSDYENELRQLSADLEQREATYNANLSATSSLLADVTTELDNLRLTHKTVVTNAANNICCKNRFDNPALDSYRIVNDRITCTVGAEDKITC